MLKIGEWLNGLLGGASKVIDELVTNDAEREALKQALSAELHRHEESLLTVQASEMANARAREVSLRDTVGVYVQYGAAAVAVLAFLGLLFAVVFKKVPQENTHLVDIMIGALGTIVTNIFGYWFGSSLGSARKTDALADVAVKR